MGALPILMSVVIVGGILFLFARQNRERAANAPLRDEIQERVSLSTPLDQVRILGTGGFRGTPGIWIRVQGPKRLVVGADAFMISMPQALREYVFTGRESSIAISRAPSRLAERDWIIITGQAGRGQLQIAITKKEGLQEIWQALAGTGVTLAPPSGDPGKGKFASAPGRAARRRRVAVMVVVVALLPFVPALVILIARHL